MDIYRVKGFVQLDDEDETQAQLQMTGGRAWLRLGATKQKTDAATSLVFIALQDKVKAISVNAMVNHYQEKYSSASLEKHHHPVKIKSTHSMSIVFG